MKSSSIGPLATHKAGLRAYLLSRCYTALSAENVVRLMAHLSRWLAKRKLSPRSLSDEAIESFLRHRRRMGYVQFRTKRALIPIFNYLVGAGVVQLVEEKKHRATRLERIQEEFSDYLVKERSVCEANRKFYVKVAGEFLSKRMEAKRDFNSLTGKDLSEFILEKFEGYGVRSCQRFVTALRSLLRFLFVRGEIRSDLSTAVPAIAGWRMSSLPKGLSKCEVKRLLDGCDRRTHEGRLGYSLLLLMVRLGLRTCEVAALQLGDIRWRQGELLVRGKGGQEDILPLPQEVGCALAAYIKRTRPCSDIRSVFVKTRAPRGPLGSGGVKRHVASAYRRAGITSTGAHRLRHTAATDMLRGGVPLPEIAQVLRHRNIDTTAIYAKVDLTSLRTLAQPWPGGVA